MFNGFVGLRLVIGCYGVEYKDLFSSDNTTRREVGDI